MKIKTYYFLLLIFPHLGTAAEASHTFLKETHSKEAACLEVAAADSRLAAFDNSLYPHLAQFIKTHPLPQRFMDVIAEAQKDDALVARLENTRRQPLEGPAKIIGEICIKDGSHTQVSRVFNALRLKNCIKLHHLNDRLDVPEKQFAHLKNGVWIVLADKVPDEECPQKFSSEMVDALIKIILYTGFADWTSFAKEARKNWHYVNGKIICIDTADDSFDSSAHRGFTELLKACGQHLSEKDQVRIQKMVTETKQQKLEDEPNLSKYDDLDNNFDEAGKEFLNMEIERAMAQQQKK